MVFPFGDQLLVRLITIWIFALLAVLESCFRIACSQLVVGWFGPKVESYIHRLVGSLFSFSWLMLRFYHVEIFFALVRLVNVKELNGS